MLTECSHLVTPLAVVAILAHARCVIDAVNMRTLRYLVSVFNFFIIRFLGFFQSNFSVALLFSCRFTHPFLWLIHRHDNLGIRCTKFILLVITLANFGLRWYHRRICLLELNCYRGGFGELFRTFFWILERLFLLKRSH